ncbi:XkdF-like putative serine protease domain-containing protein [Methanosphaera cuniculi]|uniref:XkdF-like putative serine protease domain-containing protein n=1 Tax=Methanosphaera cuniculi TaxID=1077256 RepID=UPI001FEAC148|nr:XkdF-like putative serine protease domain-containing protein [Methanosphaera cuniculi]
MTVTAPVFLPNTPDCDYADGEELLTPEKIQQLASSFKNYNIIDYEHQFTNKTKPYYLQQVGKPVQMWISQKDNNFTDVTGTTQTIPAGTLWLTSEIYNPVMIQAIKEKRITAYSATTAEKKYADELMNLVNTSTSAKSHQKEVQKLADKISFKRTLIKDIKDPVLFTVTLTGMPCVGSAMFCQSCLLDANESNKSIDEEKKMDKTTFLEKLVAFFKSLEYEEKEQESSDEKEITSTDEPTTDNKPVVDESKESDEKPEQESTTDEEETTSTDKPESTDKPKESEEPKESDKPKESEDTTTDDEKEEEEEKRKRLQSKKSNVKPTTSKKSSAKPKPNPTRNITTKSKQIKVNDGIGESQKMKKIHESEVIYDIIKNGVSTKSIGKENISFKNTGIIPAFDNQALLNMIYNPTIQESFKASFTEENTNKAVLETNLFATYVKKLILSDPILEDATYQTVYGEKANIYTIGLSGEVTQDGILPEHYYFDKDPAETNIDIGKDVLEPVPQRAKLVISDRQVRNNVYGQDLLSNALSLTQDAFNRGVSTARVFGNTKLGETVDKQYTRRDGLLVSAGQQLVSGTDFDVADGIISIFEDMFYSLPEEAQNEDDYTFYVPTNVYRAYYNYFINKVGDKVVDILTTRIPLYWENIPIKTSPTLNNAKARTDLDGGKASILLTNPKNTNFGVGRNLTIEPDRHADTSSNTYFYTMDSDAKYSIPDYAVVAKMTDDEYKALPKVEP